MHSVFSETSRIKHLPTRQVAFVVLLLATLLNSQIFPLAALADETGSTPSTSSEQAGSSQASSPPPADSTTPPPPPPAGTPPADTPPPAPPADSTSPPADSTSLPAPAGDTTIVTGDAASGANAANVVNTNTTNGGGVDTLQINSASTTDTIDLQGAFSTSTNPVATTTEGCADCQSSGGTLAAANDNIGTITNHVEVNANTGSNTASASCGNATVVSGNAAAGANLINILNTNLIASRLMAITINKLSNWFGDLILPGRDFFAGIGGGGIAPSPSLTVTNNNLATVDNGLSMNASSGANTASGDNGGVVLSGEAVSLANVLNFINTNLIGSGGTSFSIVLNFGGEWTGSIFSMPPGATLESNGSQIIISGGIPTSAAPGSLPGVVTVGNTNVATIQNSVAVRSSTGNNTAEAGCGSALVATGNARAAANILNIANTNVVGQNWFLAMINIAGDWFGNLAFGRPDLWLGEAASLSSPEPVGPGYALTYVLTVENHGNADATGVTLRDVFDGRYLDMMDLGGGSLDSGGHIFWNIGTVPMGGSVTRSYTMGVSSRLPLNTSHLINTSNVTAVEPDANVTDNSESLSILAQNVFLLGGRGGGAWPPELKIVKTNNATGPIRAPGTVHYKIVVTNVGTGLSFNSFVVDNLANPNGSLATASSWNLGEIYPGEEVTIEYDAQFATSSPSGVYINTAYAEGRGGQQTGYVVRSASATSPVEVIGISSGGTTGGGGGGSGGGGIGDLSLLNSATPSGSGDGTEMGAREDTSGNASSGFSPSIISSASAASGIHPLLERSLDRNPGGLAALFAWLPVWWNFLLFLLIAIIIANLMRDLEMRVRAYFTRRGDEEKR